MLRNPLQHRECIHEQPRLKRRARDIVPQQLTYQEREVETNTVVRGKKQDGRFIRQQRSLGLVVAGVRVCLQDGPVQ